MYFLMTFFAMENLDESLTISLSDLDRSSSKEHDAASGTRSGDGAAWLGLERAAVSGRLVPVHVPKSRLAPSTCRDRRHVSCEGALDHSGSSSLLCGREAQGFSVPRHSVPR